MWIELYQNIFFVLTLLLQKLSKIVKPVKNNVSRYKEALTLERYAAARKQNVRLQKLRLFLQTKLIARLLPQ